MSLPSPNAAVATALAEAKHASQDYESLCDRFVGVCYGLAHSGYGSAKLHWEAIPDKHKHKGKPPVGGVPFWDIDKFGHTAICVSPGMIASNDIVTSGEVSVVRIGRIAESWGATYLGWADPFYHGDTVSIAVEGDGGGTPAVTGGSSTVSLSSVIHAAKVDPGAEQGHTTDKAGTLVVERGLAAEGLLDEKFVDGSFGTKTIEAYAAWQRQLKFSGVNADGIPGIKSLAALGARHGFEVEG